MAVLLRYPRKKTWVGSGLRCAFFVHVLVVLLSLLFAAAAVALTVFLLIFAPLPPFYLRLLSYSAAIKNEEANTWNEITCVRQGRDSFTLHGDLSGSEVSVEMCVTLWLHVVGLVSDCTSVTLADFESGCAPDETYFYAVSIAPRREYPHTCTLQTARLGMDKPDSDTDPGPQPCRGAVGAADVRFSCVSGAGASAEILLVPAAGSFPVTLYTVFWIALFCLLVAAAVFSATYNALVPLAFAAARADGRLRCYLEDWAPEGCEPCARAAVAGVGPIGAKRGQPTPGESGASAIPVPWPSRSWDTCDASTFQVLS